MSNSCGYIMFEKMSPAVQQIHAAPAIRQGTHDAAAVCTVQTASSSTLPNFPT